MITKENIEERMFEYHEGLLSPEDMRAVESFVEANPEYQVDFDAWKDSYVTADKDKYAYIDALLAGTGSLWLKWTSILLLLVGSGFALFYGFSNFAGSTDNSSSSNNSSSSSTLAANDFKEQDNESKQTSSYNLGYDENDNGTEDLKESNQFASQEDSSSVKDESSDKHVMAFGNNSNVKRYSGQNSSYKKSNAFKSGSTYNSGDSYTSSDESDDANSTLKLKSHKGSQELNSVAYQGAEIQSTPERFKPNKLNKRSNPIADVSNLALAQAVEFFNDDASGGANQFNYESSNFPTLSLSNRTAKKYGKEGGLASIIRRISRQFSLKNPYGLRNSGDPYFVNPQFASAMNVNGGFAGAYNGLRTTAAYYYSDGAHLSTLALDTRIGKKFSIGIGLINNYGFTTNQTFNTEFASSRLIISPKIQLNKDVSLEPIVSIGYAALSERNTIFSGPGASFQKLQLGAGAMLNSQNFYMGVNFDNVTSAGLDYNPSIFGDPGTMRFTAVLGTDYKYSPRSAGSFSPYLMLTQQGRQTNLWAGAKAKIGKFICGASYGNHGEAAAMIGLQTNTIRIGLYGDYRSSWYTPNKILSAGGTFRLLLGKEHGSSDLPITQ